MVVGIKSSKGQPDWVNSGEKIRIKTFHPDILLIWCQLWAIVNPWIIVLRTCYFSKLPATRNSILALFSLPCVLTLPCTVAYSYCTMPIMPSPVFCPRPALLLLCPLLICPPALPCLPLPCPLLPCLQTLRFLAEATVRFCDWYIYSGIDAFVVNCVFYSIVCRFRKIKVTTISDHRSSR